MGAVLRVVQLNVGSLLEPEWPRRRHEIVAWLDHLDADVVCLQEVWQDDRHPNTAGWIAEQRPGRWHWCFGGFAAPDGFDADPSFRFGSAVLSRWSIDDHELFALPGGDSSSGDPWDAVQMELLAARTAGLDVFSTHLPALPRRAALRRLAVHFIDEQVQRRRQPASGLPPVLCGDFNAEPDSDEIRFLCGLTSIDGRDTWWQDAWRAAGAGAGYTADPSNPYCAPFNLPPKRIDYVFVGDTWLTRDTAHDASPTTRGRVLAATVAFHEPMTGTLASDHYGLVVEIGWPDRPG
jgi:endonuclease/exonuclease/phosphatase family metal-dependent hydrolase